MPYSTFGQVLDYIGVEEPTNVARAETLHRMSARYVARFSSAPDPVTPDFTLAAADAECVVFDYLYENTLKYSSLGSEDGSISYLDFDKIKQLVKDTMGPYAASRVIRIHDAERG